MFWESNYFMGGITVTVQFVNASAYGFKKDWLSKLTTVSHSCCLYTDCDVCKEHLHLHI